MGSAGAGAMRCRSCVVLDWACMCRCERCGMVYVVAVRRDKRRRTPLVVLRMFAGEHRKCKWSRTAQTFIC